jgi:hypothetical protein
MSFSNRKTPLQVPPGTPCCSQLPLHWRFEGPVSEAGGWAELGIWRSGSERAENVVVMGTHLLGMAPPSEPLPWTSLMSVEVSCFVAPREAILVKRMMSESGTA